MIRNAFKMKLKPGTVEEYKKRHDEIWPELSNAHSDAGIFDYSIYFRPLVKSFCRVWLFSFSDPECIGKATGIYD